MLKIGFPISRKENERRRALLPADIPATNVASCLVFESGYGAVIDVADDDYRRVGAIVTDRETVCECPIICNAKPMVTDEYFAPGKKLFGWIHAVQGRQITDALVKNKMTAIAWEEMFEGGRHSFWRNNEIAGEAAVIHAFLEWGQLPYESRAAVVGRGNVGRGAIRMLERFGCNVTVYDRKTSHLLRAEISRYDVVVNAVLWDVFRKDHLIYEEDLEKMRPNGLIVDISCDSAMGIQTSQPTTIVNPVYSYKGIVHYAVGHTPSLFYKSASKAISASAFSFLSDLANDTYNPVLDKATIIQKGRVLDDKIIRFQNRAQT